MVKIPDGRTHRGASHLPRSEAATKPNITLPQSRCPMRLETKGGSIASLTLPLYNPRYEALTYVDASLRHHQDTRCRTVMRPNDVRPRTPRSSANRRSPTAFRSRKREGSALRLHVYFVQTEAGTTQHPPCECLPDRALTRPLLLHRVHLRLSASRCGKAGDSTEPWSPPSNLIAQRGRTAVARSGPQAPTLPIR